MKEISMPDSLNKLIQDANTAGQTEGQGWKLSIIPHSDLPAIEAAGGLASSVAMFFENMADRTQDYPTLCLTCETEFTSKRPPKVLVTVAPNVDDTADYLVSGLCRACFRWPDMKDRVQAEVRVGLGMKPLLM